MKLSLVLFFACSAAIAEENSIKSKFGAEIRQRFYNNYNLTFKENNPVSESNWHHRNQVNATFTANERYVGYIDILHSAIWGGGANVPVTCTSTDCGGYTTSAGSIGSASTAGTSTQNAVLVQEVYLNLKASDQFSVKSGRMSLEYGDGLIFSKNDFLAVPFNTDAFVTQFHWDNLKLDAGGGKLVENGLVNPMTPTSNPQGTGVPGASNCDTEANFYFLYGAFSNLTENVKAADLYVVQIVSDSALGGGTFAPGMTNGGMFGLTHYGARVKGEVSSFDFRLEGGMQNGKQRNRTLGIDVNYSGYMLDTTAGMSFPDFMKSRIYVGYHQDSGNDSTSADKNTQYQHLFNNKNDFTGRMNVIDFGNLTLIRTGITLNPSDETSYGLEASLSSRTTERDNSTVQTRAGTGFFLTPSQTGNADKAAATEIDLWGSHNFGGGFSVLGQFGYMTLGSGFKTPGAVYGSGIQLLLQGKFAL